MKNLFLYLILLLFFCPSFTFALNSDSKQPADLQADSAILNHNTGVSVYHGNVKLTQGTTVVTADVLTTYTDKHDQLIKAIGIGTSTVPASYTTLPDNSKLPFTSVALTINYYPPRDWIEFIDQAKATQGQDNFSGPQLNYDTNQQIVISPASPKGRTHIVIQPDQKENQ
jgi:lipopolysaccharide export system protein LptA